MKPVWKNLILALLSALLGGGTAMVADRVSDPPSPVPGPTAVARIVGPEKLTVGNSGIYLTQGTVGSGQSIFVSPRERQSEILELLDRQGNIVPIFQPRSAGLVSIGIAAASDPGLKDLAVSLVTITVSPDVPPPPPVPPVPPVPPEPVFPPGKFGLAKLSYGWSLSIQAPRDASKQLAGSFRGIASSIAAGALKTPEKILEQTRLSNRSSLSDEATKAKWLPWFVSLKAELDRLSVAGTLKTDDDHRQAWTEIASGLEAVR